MSVIVRESPSENGIYIASLENLKTLIKNIAQCHACEIRNAEKQELKDNCDISVEKVATQVISSDLFEALDKTAAEEEIKYLNRTIQAIIAEDTLVKDQGIGKPAPLSYEILSLIFTQTDEKFRQKYFHELVDFYYNELCRILEKIGSNYILQKSRLDIQVKFLLPLVKFETLLKLVESGSSGNKQEVTQLVSNISNYFNNPRMNQEDIYAVIKSKIGSNNFDLISYELIPLIERNGHLGDYFQLKIDVKHQNKLEKLDLFAKFLTPKSAMLQAFVKRGPSKKEEFFYMVYLPKLKELGLSELLDFAPNCYFSRLDDVLILDDMTASGFVGLTPNNRLDYDALRLGVRQIAKFHACSFIMEEILSKNKEKPVYLNDLYGEYLEEIMFGTDNEDLKHAFDVNIDVITYLSLQFPELTGKYSEKQLREKAQNGWKLAFEKVKRSDKYRNAICHGDMYVANMLFKFDEHKACQAVAMIDFQLLRYCPPSQDLMFFLYQNAFRETLESHITELVDDYYNVLSSNLNKFNLNASKVYPRGQFDESVKYMKSEAIFHAFFYSPSQMIDPNVREKLFQDEEQFEKFRKDKLFVIKMGMKDDFYVRVMRGLITYFIELCDSGEL